MEKLYATSLVLVKHEEYSNRRTTTTMLRSYIVSATSSEEALGFSLVMWQEDRELKGTHLMTYTAMLCETVTEKEQDEKI